MVTARLPASYFDAMYQQAEDPWQFRSRWYEARKRAIVLASLPKERYRSTFEPGCSVGALTAELASRSDRVLAMDIAESAVRTARARLRRTPRVRVVHGAVPDDWPVGRFDLIVISEIAYYGSQDDALSLGSLAAEHLDQDGAVVVCHWRHRVGDYPLAGDDAQRLVREGSGLESGASHIEADFQLDILGHPGGPSVAQSTGLV